MAMNTIPKRLVKLTNSQKLFSDLSVKSAVANVNPKNIDAAIFRFSIKAPKAV
jgi:hypothetical protein